MKKLIFCTLLSLNIIFSCGFCHIKNESLPTGAKAAVVLEAESGRVLFSKNENMPLPIASTTKIMTALLALESEGLNHRFTVDSNAIKVEGSSMGLKEGDNVSLYALAGGMITASGNDAANAAAVRIGGSCEGFADIMNSRAEELGLKNTHFVTPSGLDAEGHFSTACDMALLGRAAIKNPLFLGMCRQKYLNLFYGNPPYSRKLYNHNKLLHLYKYAVGIKTGFTKKAGRCLVSAAQKDGVTLICATLNCPDDWNTHINLYERYFSLAERITVSPKLPEMQITGGAKSSVKLKNPPAFSYTYIENVCPHPTYKVFTPKFCYAPVKRGDILGKIVYYRDGSVAAEYPLRAAEDVPPKVYPEGRMEKFNRHIINLFKKEEF